MNIERDVLDRLVRLEIPFYVTGSWALSVYAEAAVLGVDRLLETTRAG